MAREHKSADTQAIRATERFMTALCLWREARGQPPEAQRGVCHVIRNRLKDPRWPNDAVGVILQPKQFSAFNRRDPNATKFPRPTDAEWLRCYHIAGDPGPDPTGGANHYESCPEGDEPQWADDAHRTVRLGAFEFYKL